MGRKSLLQSTKKAAQKKKAAEKAVRAAAPAGTGVKTQSTSGKGAASVKEAKVTETKGLKAAVLDKKTVPAKKIATPKAAVAPKRDAAKPKIAAAPAKKVEVSLKDLLFKRFDTGGKVHPVEVKKAATQIPDAPPFVSGGDKKETERIRGLLFKAFQVVAGSETAGEKPGAAAKPRIAAAPAKKVEVSLKDLLFKRFDTGGKVHPVEVKKAATQIPDAPPFVSGGDKKETERIRGLLFKAFRVVAGSETAGAESGAAGKPKAAASAKKVEVSLKDLLFKRFDTGGKVHPVEVKKAATQIPDAPPFVSGGDKKETERIRGLLFKAFRVVAGSETAGEKPGAAAKPRIAAAPAKKVEVSLKDLLFKRFDTGGKVHPVEVKKAATQIADAPPFVSGGDKKETERIRGLLFKKFALTESPGVVGKGPSPTAATPSAVKDIPPYKPASCPPGQAAGKGKKIALCALVALVAILLGASFSNQNNFYLKEKNGAVEVWRGKFAPAGEELLFNLDGMKLPEDVKNVYSKKEISPILFNFLQDKADALLDAPQGPDFGAVKGHLRQARDFAPTPMLRAGIESRLRGIDFMVLFYKADIALGKGTLPDLMAAKAYLGKALSFASTSYQRDLLAKMTTVADEAIAALPEK